MPLAAPNLYPGFNTIRLSHGHLTVKDLAASRIFYTEIPSPPITDESDTRFYLRAMTERGHPCVVQQKLDAPGTVEVMGFKIFGEETRPARKPPLTGKAASTSWIERPHQSRMPLTSDNFGIKLGFFQKIVRLTTIHQQYALCGGVGQLSINHFNYVSPDVEASHRSRA
jgi:catechol 2,3-dioxygenase